MEHWAYCAGHYIGTERSGTGDFHDSNEEARIRNFGVGIIAIATIAVAGLFFKRRRDVPTVLTGRDQAVDQLYAAGL